MCGIVGAVSVGYQEDRKWLLDASNTLIHRGPDHAGEWWSEDGRVGLAHRRLSILDLSPLGFQPMAYVERGLSVVFNGEIYNFTELRKELQHLGYNFRSQSDTEVLLVAYAQWGIDCVNRLNGMFVFAIYDAFKQKLFLARDRAGEKPLFYHNVGSRLYFASELKALLANPTLPRRINSDALDCYLAMGYVPGHSCILDNYNKLPPAHAMSFDLRDGKTNIWRYWELPALDSDAEDTDQNTLVDELEALFEDAVGKQLVADVPVGILLSGGVDSSLVTAMAIRRCNKVHTFSIGFPGHSKFNETAHASLIARYFDTEHTELEAKPTTAELLPTLVRQFDEPMVDSSMFPTWLVSHLVRQHCTVALGGDGADELFGGYGHYSRLISLQEQTQYLPLFIRRKISGLAERILPLGFADSNVRTWLMAVGIELNGNGFPLITSFFDPITRRRLMRNINGYSLVAEDIFETRIPHQNDLLQRATRLDFQNYLAEDILVKVDRASMLNSLEIRAPFLDVRLIEFAFSRVPSHLKATVSDKKLLLKLLAKRVLPSEFDRQRKQGFSIPLADWLKAGPFRELFWDTLTSADTVFDSSTIEDLLNGQDRGRKNGERLFALVQFELWRKMYGASF